MPAVRVFISYRRDDAGDHAGRIADHLVGRYGPDAVFRDVETIEAGEDFVEAIERAIWDADLVLVVIGRAWLRATDAEGRRRLEDPKDFVRLEVEAALRRGVRTVPLLVGEASMPRADDLPPTLSPLARRNAVPLDEARLDEDLEALLATLEAGVALDDDSSVHLPPQPTPFIGREAEIASIQELLEREEVRLLTVIGPGGVGKTRITIEIAAHLADRFPDGVWFVGLSALRDADLLAPTIATTLGLHEGFGSSLEETVQRFLRDRRILLVIDNVEQLLPGAAAILSDLVGSARKVKLLVSSREPVGVRAERVYPVPELGAEDAVALFTERTRATVPGWELDGAEAAAVGAICAKLEGLPLAIELAAARVDMLSVGELLERLDESLPVLTGGALDAPERQRTMRAAIAWSHDLLGEHEQRSFAKLGVFRGGWTLDAAETICDVDLDALRSLHEKSLIRRTAGRFGMLETIREYAAERLEGSPEGEAIVRRHLESFVAMAEEAELGSRRGEREAWFDRLEADHDNLRSALARVQQAPDPVEEVRLVTALWRFWAARGYVAEGLRAIDHALARNSDVPLGTRLGRCYLGSMAGLDFLTLLPETRALAAECTGEDDRFARVQALTLIGMLEGALGHQGAAEAPLNEAVDVSAGDFPAEEAEAIGWLLIGALYGPTPVDRGIARCRDALDRSDADRTVQAFAFVERAALEAMRGAFDLARRLLEEGRSIFLDLDLKVFGANTAQEAFFVEMLADDPGAAAADLVAAYDVLLRFGERGFLSTIAGYLAHVYYALGDLEEAERYAGVSKDAAADDDWISQGLWRSALAKVLARRGDVDPALALAREAVRLMASTDFINTHADRLTDLAEVLRMARSPEADEALDQAHLLYERKGNLVGIRRAESALGRSTGSD